MAGTGIFQQTGMCFLQPYQTMNHNPPALLHCRDVGGMIAPQLMLLN
jgi:hypothetical protein